MATGEYYQIRVRGHLGSRWCAWFDGLTVADEPNGETVLAGPVADQAALHGILARIRDLGLPLLSVTCITTEAASHLPTADIEEEM